MGLNFTVKVRDCQTADDVIANRKEVLSRIRAWKAPERPRIVEIVKEVEQEIVTLAQRIAPQPVPPENVDSVEEKRYPPIAEIITTVSRFYGVSENDIKSHRRQVTITRPRQIVMYLARNLTLLTLPQIGRKLGDRDHTTIMHGIAKIEALRGTYAKLNAELIDLESRLT
jgi:chromosomal replication initiation ATPase DnaA